MDHLWYSLRVMVTQWLVLVCDVMSEMPSHRYSLEDITFLTELLRHSCDDTTRLFNDNSLYFYLIHLVVNFIWRNSLAVKVERYTSMRVLMRQFKSGQAYFKGKILVIHSLSWWSLVYMCFVIVKIFQHMLLVSPILTITTCEVRRYYSWVAREFYIVHQRNTYS